MDVIGTGEYDLTEWPNLTHRYTHRLKFKMSPYDQECYYPPMGIVMGVVWPTDIIVKV